MLLNKSATLDHFCIRNDKLHTIKYSHETAIPDRIRSNNHFNITSRAASLEYKNAYIQRHITQKSISHTFVISNFVLIRKLNGLVGKLK